MEHDKSPLSDYCSIVKGLSYKGEYIHQEGPALLGIGTIKEGGGFRPENVRTYGGSYKEEHVLRPGDVYVALTSQDGFLIGSPAMVPKDFKGIGITTHHDAKVDWKIEDQVKRDFLFWLMHTYDFIRHCINFSVGTTVYATHGRDVERFFVPKELNQNQISMTAILNSISELEPILKSSRILLEEQIKSVFRSWFVDFDPVKAKAEGRLPSGMDEDTAALFPDSFEDSELGPIPSGWTVGTIHDIAKQRKDMAKPDEFNDMLPYIGLEHMPRNSIALTEWGNSEGLKSNKFRFSKKDILFGKLRPYFHKVGPATLDGVCSTDILVIQPIDEKLGGFLLPILSSEHFVNFVSGITEGVGLPRTKWEHFKLYKIALPPVEIREGFASIVEPMLRNIESSIHQFRFMELTRDALLTRLMSGELSVS